MGNTTQSVWETMRLPLQRFIARRVHNTLDAEDLLQTIFCKIHDNINELQNETKIHAWIFQIARNTIVDYYRSKKSDLPLQEAADESVLADAFEPDLSEEVAGCLKTIIGNLPEKYQTAILLTEFEQITQKDLAERMGVSLSGAKSRVQRGRSKLREILLGCCHVDFDRRGNIIDYRRKRATCKYC